jgi:hypothetical protein
MGGGRGFFDGSLEQDERVRKTFKKKNEERIQEKPRLFTSPPF